MIPDNAVDTILLADLFRFSVMFILGVAVALEIGSLRFIHVAIWLPDSTVRTVPVAALMLFGLSRVIALFVMALLLHDHFGEPLHWYSPLIFSAGISSLLASAIVTRSTV